LHFTAGFFAFVLSIGGVLGCHAAGVFDLGIVHDEFIQIISTAIVFSFALSVYLYATSFGEGKMLSIPGNTGPLCCHGSQRCCL
jgi:hypothetical protein